MLRARSNDCRAVVSLFLIALVLVMTCCGKPADNGDGTLIGTIVFWEGDFMPGWPTGMKTPVVREVLVYEPTSAVDVTPSPPGFGPFYSAIHTRLVATVQSSSNGHFILVLPAATYSIFVRENGQYYANRYSDDHIFPVTVVSATTTSVIFDITYLATF